MDWFFLNNLSFNLLGLVMFRGRVKCDFMFDMSRLMGHFKDMLDVGNMFRLIILRNLRIFNCMNILIDFLKSFLLRLGDDIFLVGLGMFFMDNFHDLLVLWFVLDFHSVKLSLNVRNMMSLHVSFGFLMLLHGFNNNLLLMMNWSRLQMNWRFFNLCSCFNMFNGFRFLVFGNFIVYSLIVFFAFLDL